MTSHESQLRDPEALVHVHRYEELRSVATGARDDISGAQGLGVLLCRGMAAWIMAQIGAPPQPSPAVHGSRDVETLPPHLPSELVGVLAGITLSLTTEVRA
jgi:hypothetical protein